MARAHEVDGFDVERLCGLAALEALAEPWEDLCSRAGVDALCNGPRWVLSHARAFAPGAEPIAVALRGPSGELAALAAFKREPRRGRLALRRAQFLADGSFDTDYEDVPCLPGAERAAAVAVLDALDAAGGVDAVLLSMVRRDSRFLAALSAELVRRGLSVRSSPALGAALDLPDDFEAYVGSLRSRMRSKVRQALRRAEEGAHFEWSGPDDDLSPWLGDLWDLHGRRWELAGRPGSFRDARRRTWYEDLVPRERAAGTLALARLVREGRTIAVQYGLLRGHTYYQVQEGYDPDLESERPGTQLRALMIRDLIARGVRRYDFMEGFTRHKAEWGALEVPCVTVSFPLPRLVPRAVFAAKALVERYRESSS